MRACAPILVNYSKLFLWCEFAVYSFKMLCWSVHSYVDVCEIGECPGAVYLFLKWSINLYLTDGCLTIFEDTELEFFAYIMNFWNFI